MVKTCGPVDCRPSGGGLEPETDLSPSGETRSESTIRSDEMRADKLGKGKIRKLTYALSLAGEIEPSGLSATGWRHNWTSVTPPATKQKWPYLGNKEKH